MTDKEEIIIDGVDVSKCCWCDSEPNTEPYCRINDGEDLNCEENLNCYYKQFKRIEKEYEELRRYHNKCCKENIEKLEQWLEKYNQLSRDFYNGKYCNKENCSLLKAKEQECKQSDQKLKNIKERLSRVSYLDPQSTRLLKLDIENIIGGKTNEY